MQVPDELAGRAEDLYGRQKFGAAFEVFAEAVDKLHSMEVVAAPGSRLRVPSNADRPILAGLVKSLGASLAMGDAPRDYRDIAAKSAYYLGEIAEEAARVGVDAGDYSSAVAEVSRTIRMSG